MALLKIDSKNKGHKLVGACVEPHIHQFFTLYTLAKGTSKSKLFKSMFNEWIVKQRISESDDVLLHEIIERINIQWETEKMNSPSLTFAIFKKLFHDEMIAKDLKPSYISMVLDGMKE